MYVIKVIATYSSTVSFYYLNLYPNGKSGIGKETDYVKATSFSSVLRAKQVGKAWLGFLEVWDAGIDHRLEIVDVKSF